MALPGGGTGALNGGTHPLQGHPLAYLQCKDIVEVPTEVA